MRGQLSAEMMILIVVVLAIVAIAATQLIGSAKDAEEEITTQSDDLYKKTSAAMKGSKGDFCVDADDCLSESCTDHKCD